jgi:hypothetical protein
MHSVLASVGIREGLLKMGRFKEREDRKEALGRTAAHRALRGSSEPGWTCNSHFAFAGFMGDRFSERLPPYVLSF